MSHALFCGSAPNTTQTLLLRDDFKQFLPNARNGVVGEDEENGANDRLKASRRQQLCELGNTVHKDLQETNRQQPTSRVLYLTDFAKETILKKKKSPCFASAFIVRSNTTKVDCALRLTSFPHDYVLSRISSTGSSSSFMNTGVMPSRTVAGSTSCASSASCELISSRSRHDRFSSKLVTMPRSD